MSPEPAVRAVHVSKRVRDGDRRVDVLTDVSLDLTRGEIVVVSGPSGAGKTTLLAILGGMLLPTEGEVFLGGEPVSRLRDAHRALVRRRTVGFVFQDLALVPELSVLFLDEPTAHLDDARTDELARHLEELAQGGLAVCAASHDPRLRARASRVVGLAQGRLVEADA